MDGYMCGLIGHNHKSHGEANLCMALQQPVVRAAEIRGATWALEAKVGFLPLYTTGGLGVDAARIVNAARTVEVVK